MISKARHDQSTFPTPGHWYGAQLHEDDWRLPIPIAAIDELDRALDRPDAAPPRVMPAVQALMDRLHERMFFGSGVAIGSQLPVREWGIARTRAAIAILADAMGPPTQQTHDGVTFYRVEDRGAGAAKKVRRSLTNLAQPFHSDGPWLRQPPWVIALYCLRPARSGGLSHCLSLRALTDDLAMRSPELADRVTRNMFWHRQGEHARGEPPMSEHPMVWHDANGRWCGRLYADYVVNGYRAANQPMDNEACAALGQLADIASEPHRRLEYRLGAGEVAWLNNRWCVHARTGFEALEFADAPRLLVRVWHRLRGDAVILDS